MEDMARELMAITGLTAQEIVHLARSAFGTVGGRIGAASSAATVLRMRVFLNNGITPDGLGIDLVGMYPHTATGQCIAGIIPDSTFGLMCVPTF